MNMLLVSVSYFANDRCNAVTTHACVIGASGLFFKSIPFKP